MASLSFFQLFISEDENMSLRESIENKDIALIDILDVILDKGVAIKADLVISIAGVDLVYLDLRLLIASVDSLFSPRRGMARRYHQNSLTHKGRS